MKRHESRYACLTTGGLTIEFMGDGVNTARQAVVSRSDTTWKIGYDYDDVNVRWEMTKGGTAISGRWFGLPSKADAREIDCLKDIRDYLNAALPPETAQNAPESIPTVTLTQRVEALEEIHKAELEVFQCRKNNKEGT